MTEEYTYFNKISERISLIEKYQKFKEDETVRCTEKQYDDEGVLEKNSVLIVQDVMLERSGIEKTKNGEPLSEDDIKYMCCHADTEKIFWINGSQLEKAVGSEAESTLTLDRYRKQCFRKKIFADIVVGLRFLLGLGKLMNFDLNNIYIRSLFTITVVGLTLIITAIIRNCSDYSRKRGKRQ